MELLEEKPRSLRRSRCAYFGAIVSPAVLHYPARCAGVAAPLARFHCAARRCRVLMLTLIRALSLITD